MEAGKRVFVITEGDNTAVFGGLAEVARVYNISYHTLAKSFREGKTTVIKDDLTIKAVHFRKR
jgi:DNA-binding phage protein